MQPPPAQATNRPAITSLVCSLSGWLVYILSFLLDAVVGAVTFGLGALCLWPLDFIPPILWLVAVVAGHVAVRRIRRDGTSGRGLAIAGLILGYAGLAFLLAIVLLVIFLLVSGIGLTWLMKFFSIFQPPSYKSY